MELYSVIQNILEETSLSKKIQMARVLKSYRADDDELVGLNERSNADYKPQPGRPENFKVVHPRDVPMRRDITNPIQKAHFLHAIANIELLAVELPLLSLLRFGVKNLQRLHEQLALASEEAFHFSLLRQRLDDWGIVFGSIPVHHGLWDYALKCDCELEHQILVPCYLEARGLDVCPEFVEKFKKIEDPQTAEILSRILNDEVLHVAMGVAYLKDQAYQRQMKPQELFRQVLLKCLGPQLKSRIPLNNHYRKQAGLTEALLDVIR